jgi:hypothetical protein
MACQCIYRDRSNTQRDSNSIAGRFCQLPQRYSPISRHRSLVAQPPTTTRRAGRSVAAHRKHSTCRSASSGTETPLKQIRAIAVRRRRRERLDNARTPHAPRGAGPRAWSSIRARLVPRAHRPARRRLPWIPGTRRTPCPPRPLQRRHWLDRSRATKNGGARAPVRRAFVVPATRITRGKGTLADVRAQSEILLRLGPRARRSVRQSVLCVGYLDVLVVAVSRLARVFLAILQAGRDLLDAAFSYGCVCPCFVVAEKNQHSIYI